MLCLSFNSRPAFPSLFINCSSRRRCRHLLVLVTSFVCFSACKLRILLKDIDNCRHNRLVNNKRHTVSTRTISGAEKYRLTHCVTFTTYVKRISVMHMILVPHIVLHYSSIHFVRHIVITNFIKLQIKCTSS